MKKIIKIYILTIFLIFNFSFTSIAEDFITLQSTTSTQNSGLYDYILPIFTKKTNIMVRVVAVGTGQAIKNAEKCDGDVLLVHSKDSEENFVREGYGLFRYDLMHNDFVIIGPMHDPAGIKKSDNLNKVFKTLYNSKFSFTSRGDNSGTHKAEINYWKNIGLNVSDFKGQWYRELGLGMGSTLNVTIQMNAYTLTDRATWLSFNNKDNHKILFQGDESLFNQYGIILINPEVCPSSKKIESDIFVKWMLSEEGTKAISSFQVEGHQLFFPNRN